MADANMHNFDKRVTRINKRKRKLERNGAELVVAEDGLISAQAKRRSPKFPWRGVFLTLAVFFVLKGMLLAHLGPITYDGRVAQLEEGTVFEQAGGYAMKADPVTKWAASALKNFLP